MGNHRFRLTDMMPNAWFYKLRDMSSHTRRRTTRRIHNKNQPSTASTQAVHKEPPIPCHRQNSFYNNTGSPLTLAQHISFGSPSRNTKAFDIHLPPNPPRKSPRRLSTHRKSVYKPSISRRTKVLVDQSRGSHPNASVWSDSDPGTDDEDALYYSISPCSDHLSSAADSLPSSDPFDDVGSWSSSCSPRFSSSTADIIIDLDQKPPPSAKKMLEKFDNRVSLPPILTKATSKYKPEPKKHDDLHQEIRKALHEHHRSLSIELLKHETDNRRRQQRTCKEKATNDNKDTTLLVEKEPKRKSSVKVRGRNSPRLVTVSIRKMQAIHGSKARRTSRRSVSVVSSSRSSISESLAVIRCSYEPEKDFKDSMMEMIVEHHIQASKDLEELLACYLTLNSNEYHDLIVKAFEQVWCDMFSTPVCTAESLAGDVSL